MKNKDNLYVGIAYSALDIPNHIGVMSEQWAEIGGHKCLGTFLLEKVCSKNDGEKSEQNKFMEYRTKQAIKGTSRQFHRPDDLPLASECNEYFLHWFLAPVSAAENMLDIEAYKALPIEKINKSLSVVEGVFEAGAKDDDVDLAQDSLKLSNKGGH